MARAAVFLMYGLGGRAWSAGIADKLGPMIRALPSVYCPRTFQWTEWQSIVSLVDGLPGDMKVAVAGHSMSANELPNVARGMNKRVLDLAVGYDPTIWYSCPSFPANTRRVINFHGVNWLNPIGHARYSVDDPAHTKLTTYNTSDLHTDIDDDNALHAITVAAIKELLV